MSLKNIALKSSLRLLHSYYSNRSLTSDHSPAVLNSNPLCRFIPVFFFSPFSPTISTCPRPYIDFLVSRKTDLLRRSYVAQFPGMRRPIPSRPVDAMDHATLDEFHPPSQEISDTNATPEGAVAELKFAVTRNADINSKAPKFKVHNLRAAFELGGEIIHVISSTPEHSKVIDSAAKVIKMDLKKNGIKEVELEELWFDELGDADFMWGHGLLKHSKFSSHDVIEEYGPKTYDLAKPILKGENGGLGLGEFLLQEGFKVGKYYDVADLMVSLKKKFGVDVYPTFVGHGGHHPSLFEIGLLVNRDCTRRLDHPMASKVPKGKFLPRDFHL